MKCILFQIEAQSGHIKPKGLKVVITISNRNLASWIGKIFQPSKEIFIKTLVKFKLN